MDKIVRALYRSLCVLSIISSAYSVKFNQTRSCPIWHIPIIDHGGHTTCVCGAKFNDTITCDDNLLYVQHDYCLTWNNSTISTEIHRCLLDHPDTLCTGHHLNTYHVPINISGMELNYLTCQKLNNRQGNLCAHCIDGYGPAVFPSNGILCVDCSKHRYLWILNVLFQLSMVTLLCLVVILLQINGTSSPLNVIIMYFQVYAVGLKISGGTHNRLVCYFGRVFMISILTVIDVLNLNFFHALIPPLCISPSTKAINSLLFDYLVAFYPLVFTSFVYVSIELYDRNFRIFLLFSCPIRKCMTIFHTTWDPRRTILNTFITFFLLSYSKLLFVSINLLIASQSFNSRGERVPNTVVLLYDPSIRFFHSEHIPYAVLALLVIVVFVLLPLLVLVLYPTRLFRQILLLLKFQRWDILHQIMNIFQGWYKDGTEGTRDYRSFSALYLLLRAGFGCLFVAALLRNDFGDRYFQIILFLGVFQILLGVVFFIIKPHRKTWMSNADGIIFTLFGIMSLLVNFSKHVYILGAIIGPSVLILTVLYYAVRKCIKDYKIN